MKKKKINADVKKKKVIFIFKVKNRKTDKINTYKSYKNNRSMPF